MTQALFTEFQNQAMPQPAQSAWEDSGFLRAVKSSLMTVQLLRSHSSLSLIVMQHMQCALKWVQRH
jgi:hypothetical protein